LRDKEVDIYTVTDKELELLEVEYLNETNLLSQRYTDPNKYSDIEFEV
jgi:hypothetical protein